MQNIKQTCNKNNKVDTVGSERISHMSITEEKPASFGK
jgi:hypothetical protein